MASIEFAHQLGLTFEGGWLRKTNAKDQQRGTFVSAASERALRGEDDGVQFEIGQYLQGFFAVGFVSQEDKDTQHTPGTMVLGAGVNQRGEIWAFEEGNRGQTFVAQGQAGDQVGIKLTTDGAAFTVNGEIVKEIQGNFARELHVKVVADWSCGKRNFGRLPVRNIKWLAQEPNMVVSVYSHGNQENQVENEDEIRVVQCLTMGGNDLARIEAPKSRSVESLTKELAAMLDLPLHRVKLVDAGAKLLELSDTVSAIA